MLRLFPLIGVIFTFFLFFFFWPKNTFASEIVKQTDQYSDSLNVWQVIQELGDNLNGPFGSFTFRVHTTLPNSQQFNFTAQNTRLYDKTTNTLVLSSGCIPQGANPNDELRGLIFRTQNVPTGFQDVIVDFSCHNFSFILGHRYLIKISNANNAFNTDKRILFASAAYQQTGQDFFTGGGLKYAFDNSSCDPFTYIWKSPSSNLGCNVFTNFKDDLYFILSDEPPPPPLPPPPPAKTPVIFIPGIGGSELKTSSEVNWSKDNGHGGVFTNIYAAGEKVWVNTTEAAKPGNDDYFDVLRMKSNGTDSEANLELTDTLAGVYQETINFFNSNGYTLGTDFFIFPYDWRKDLSLTEPLLDQKIEQIKTLTGTSKVDIVAHSMGGLVARNYIKDPTKAGKVRKLIELGVPHLGSVELLKNLRYGGCLTIPELQNLPACIGLTNSEVKDVVQNFIGTFELAPTQKYFQFYDGSDSNHPFPIKDTADLDNNGVKEDLNYGQIKTFLTNLGHNTALFNPSETFHNIDNSLANTNGVETILVVGSGLPTLGQIIEQKFLNISKRDRLNINGDNTVPLFSASLIDPEKNNSLIGSAKIFYTKQSHNNLVLNGPTMNLVKNVLNSSDQLPSGISNQPFHLKGKQISVHSPVNIEITDSNGNKTGIESDGTIKEDIPGSFFDTLDDAKFIWLPEDGIYDVKLTATDNGSFDLKIRNYEEDVNDKTILYQEIPIQNTTQAELDFNTTSSTPPVLEIDQDGNGTTDLQKNPTAVISGNENSDTTAPEAQIIFNTQTKKLEILGIDNLSTVNITQTLIKKLTDFVLVDATNNTTKINTKFADTSIELNNIIYKTNPLITLPTNSFKVSFTLDRKTNQFKTLTQTITIKNQITLKATFDPKKNETKIESTEYKKKKITQIKTGLVLLKLTTKEGKLITEF